MSHDEVMQYLDIKQVNLGPTERDNANDESIAGLAQNMGETGQLHPIHVYWNDGRCVTVDGTRRLHAAQRLGWQRIKAIVNERELTPGEAAFLRLSANLQRKSLTGLQAARGIEELRQLTGWNASETARRLGYSVGTVSKLLALLKLPPEVQNEVGLSISTNTAYQIAKVEDPSAREELARAAVGEKLTRDAVAKRARGSQKKSKRRKSALDPKVIAELGERRSIAVQGPGLVSLETLIAWLGEALDALQQALYSGYDLKSLPSFLQERQQSMGREAPSLAIDAGQAAGALIHDTPL